jgi:hypothetical protein
MKYRYLTLMLLALLLPINVFSKKINDVSFISQVPPGIWTQTLNCGQTSYLMIDSQLKGYRPTSDMIKDIDDWLFNKYGDPIRDYNGSVTNVNKIKSIAINYGNHKQENIEISTNGDLEVLKQRLDRGDLIIVAVFISMGLIDYNNGHFMVVTGYDDTHFYFNDPGKTLGKDNKYRTEDFIAAWARQNYSHIIFTEQAIPDTVLVDEGEQLEVLPESSVTKPKPQNISLFQRVKSFFSQLFNSVQVEGEVLDTEIPPSQTTTNVDGTTSQTDIPENLDVPLFDAEILPIDIIRIGTEDREALITVRARNTGNQTWTRSAVSLNVVGGRSTNAPYRHSSWLTDLRPTRVDQERVEPGDIGTFTLLVRIPETESTITFRAQLVQQTGSQFDQIGTQFAVATIQKEIPSQQEISENSTAETGSVPPPRSGIIRQIQEVIVDVTKNVQESISQTIDTIVDTTQRIIFGGGSSRRVTENNGTEEENGMMPELRVVSPTSSPYIATTSTFELSGIINDVVSQVNVDTTASGTLSFSTTSLTWQWIGDLTGGTTTFSVVARAGERVSDPVKFTVYYAPQYELTAPIITSPTTDSVWYTNVSEVELRGSVDSRASSVSYLSEIGSILPVTSSTWQHVITNMSEGIVRHTYQAIDTFENTSPTTSIDVVYDGTAPLLTTSTGILTSTTLSLVTTATDTLSGIDTYEWQVRIADTDIDACIDSTSTVAIDAWTIATSCEWGNILLDTNETVIELPEQLQEQNLVIRARAVDRAQNTSDWILYTVMYTSPVTGPTYAAIRNALITEVGWMGTKSSPNDEWIEIVIIGNTVIDVHHWWLVWGSYDIDLGRYEYEVELTYDDMTEDEALFIPPGYPILFERTDDTTINDIYASFIYTGALSNSGAYMAILNADREIVDELDTASGWFAGNNTTKASMMRRGIVGDSNDSNSWCTYTDCTPTDFLWSPSLGEDSLGNPIVGTPGGPVFGEPILEL